MLHADTKDGSQMPNKGFAWLARGTASETAPQLVHRQKMLFRAHIAELAPPEDRRHGAHRGWTCGMTISLPLACLSSSTSSESEEGREKCVEKERARERERTNKLAHTS